MSKKKSYRRYSPEFKREAIKRACDEGVTDAAVCKDLGVSTRQFRRRRDELHLMGEDAFPGQGRSHDDEVTRLKRELAKMKQARMCWSQYCWRSVNEALSVSVMVVQRLSWWNDRVQARSLER